MSALTGAVGQQWVGRVSSKLSDAVIRSPASAAARWRSHAPVRLGSHRHEEDSERQVSFRFVRHLPEPRHAAVHATGLRAGVGQTLGEETAAHTAMPAGSYGAMAIVSRALVRTVLARQAHKQVRPGLHVVARLVRCVVGRLGKASGVTWQRNGNAVHAGSPGLRTSDSVGHRRTTAVTAHSHAQAARESTARA